YQFGQRHANDLALQCKIRLLRRPDPAWSTCNSILNILLKRTGKLELDDLAREAIRRVEARMPDLGQSAIDAIAYNLACVFARAGDAERALVALRRCTEPRKQNPNPESDTDLELVWNHPEFPALLAGVQPVGQPPAPEEPPYDVPPEHAVPRFEITFEERAEAEGAVVDRLGGKPNAPTADLVWPTSSSRPMDLVAQLVGKAAGGAVDLGDIHVLQIFADLEGDFYEEGEHAVIAHRAPCPAVVEPPATVATADVRVMKLEAGFDDRRLLDDDFDSPAAHSHAWCDKLGGIPIGANLDPDFRDSEDEPMRLVLELVSYDDYFLWALLANEGFTEFHLEIVRG
ncbi:MAG: hypothetical protein H0V17_33155, partial [Deltaproteobacteria bacterium]|nr:hypothetical protein [Deltaproteobacteria bacterium]